MQSQEAVPVVPEIEEASQKPVSTLVRIEFDASEYAREIQSGIAGVSGNRNERLESDEYDAEDDREAERKKAEKQGFDPPDHHEPDLLLK